MAMLADQEAEHVLEDQNLLHRRVDDEEGLHAEAGQPEQRLGELQPPGVLAHLG